MGEESALFELFEGSLIHFLAVILSVGVVYYAVKVRAILGGEKGNALNYFFIGFIFLMLIHTTELLGEEGIKLFSLKGESQEILEHFLFFIGMIFLMVSFSKLAGALIDKKETKNRERRGRISLKR